MMANKQWNPKKIYTESKNWLEKAYDFSYARPRKELTNYVEDNPLEFGYGNVMGALKNFSFWHENKFVVEAFEDKECAKSLYKSFDYNFWEALITDGYWATLENIGFGKSLNDYVSYLAKGISIGCWAETEVLGKLILKNLRRKGWFSSLETTKLAPFMLALFCDWQKLSMPDKSLFAQTPNFYDGIINNWKTESFEKLEIYLLQACDFHVERSRQETRQAMFEFNWEFYRVYPAEILSVLRLREKIGLPNSIIRHSLMDLPTAKLFDTEISKDEFFEKVKQKVVKELNIQIQKSPRRGNDELSC